MFCFVCGGALVETGGGADITVGAGVVVTGKREVVVAAMVVAADVATGVRDVGTVVLGAGGEIVPNTTRAMTAKSPTSTTAMTP